MDPTILLTPLHNNIKFNGESDEVEDLFINDEDGHEIERNPTDDKRKRFAVIVRKPAGRCKVVSSERKKNLAGDISLKDMIADDASHRFKQISHH